LFAGFDGEAFWLGAEALMGAALEVVVVGLLEPDGLGVADAAALADWLAAGLVEDEKVGSPVSAGSA
jgi:hypothetical protein